VPWPVPSFPSMWIVILEPAVVMIAVNLGGEI
jgi:hypothetical protein